MASSTGFLLAIPSYNCGPQLKRLLESLDSDLIARFNAILIVDNQSRDESARVAMEFANAHPSGKFMAVSNPSNRGLGGTFKICAAFAEERGLEGMAFLHGDAQANPEDLIPMLRLLQSDPTLEAVLGSRFSAGAKRKGYSRRRVYGNLALNRIYSFVAGAKIEDLGSGLNIYRSDLIAKARISDLPDHIAFDAELLLRFVGRKRRFVFFPIEWQQTDQTSNAPDIATGMAVLKILYRWRTQWKT